MKIAFSGHRDRTVPPELLDALAAEFPGAVWCHGGAEGFDAQVGAFARAHNIPQTVIRPDYRAHGRPAPLIRNREIVAGASLLVALYDGRPGGGTVYTIRYARSVGVAVRILRPAERQEQHPIPCSRIQAALSG